MDGRRPRSGPLSRPSWNRAPRSSPFGAPGRVVSGVVAVNVLPNYRQFDTTEWVAYGYNIESGIIGINLLTALTYFGVVAIVGISS